MNKNICGLAFGLLISLGSGFTAQAQNKGSKTDRVYEVADKKPTYPGGEEGVKQYFKDALKSYVFNQSGTVVLSMVIDKTGQVQDVSITKGINSVYDPVVVLAAQRMTGWQPGEKGKEKVNVRITQPVEIMAGVNKTPKQEVSDDRPYAYVEQMPVFSANGGNLMEFMAANTKYPESGVQNNIEGTVYVRFIVGSDGQIRDPKILKGLSPDFDQEVIRVVNMMPKWIPGKQNGKPVPVEYNLPFKFSLAKSQPVDQK